MNYFKLIEPYLYGNLSPEEQLVFERQLTRNPALANEFSIRFSLVRMLMASPAYPSMPAAVKSLKTGNLATTGQSGMLEWLWLACTGSIVGGLFLGYLYY